MHYHATLVTADGAYHCPMGSIMAIFVFFILLCVLLFFVFVFVIGFLDSWWHAILMLLHDILFYHTICAPMQFLVHFQLPLYFCFSLQSMCITYYICCHIWCCHPNQLRMVNFMRQKVAFPRLVSYYAFDSRNDRDLLLYFYTFQI